MNEPLSTDDLKSVIIQMILDEFQGDPITFRTASLIADISILESYKNIDKMCLQVARSKLEKLI